jgi:glycine betaine/choline ABC-type transport system substrate-binding protein
MEAIPIGNAPIMSFTMKSNPLLNRRDFLAASSMVGLTACQSTPKLIVGSKDSVENRLLFEITAQLLEGKLKARLDRRAGLMGSSVPYQSMQGGDMDLYPEYTRIAFKVLLKAQEQADSGLMLEELRRGLGTNAQASCLPFLGFQNTYTAVVLADNVNFSTIRTLSEACATSGGWRLGCTSDFAQSSEGYADLKLNYKLEEQNGTRLEPINQLFFGLRERRIDILITGSTDPRLTDSRYRVLADDLNVFSPNGCTLIYRNDAAKKYPSILPVLQSLSGKFTSESMQKLNGEVEIQKRGFAEVAAEWLKKEKLV